MRRRTKSRELALQFLYQWDLRGEEILQDLAPFLKKQKDAPAVKEFASSLIQGVLRNKPELDRLIVDVAQNWELSRMSSTDRNVLRLAIHELLHLPETPPKVVMNEAIDLAKRYGTEQSGKFVNGILDKIQTSLPNDKNGKNL